ADRPSPALVRADSDPAGGCQANERPGETLRARVAIECALRRYSRGVDPNCSRNAREKCDTLLNPRPSAISVTERIGSVLLVSSRAADSSLRLWMNLVTPSLSASNSL